MSAQNSHQAPLSTGQESTMPPLLRGVMWVAISALIAGAVLCVVWVLLSPEGDVIPKAFLTILMLAGFAGVALLDAHLASGRRPWVVTVSMIAWVVSLLCGLALVWVPFDDVYVVVKAWNFILIVAFIQLTVLHQRLLWKAHARFVTPFTRVLVIATTLFVVALLVMSLVPLTLPEVFEYPDLYGRVMVALAILGAVGTALVPIFTAMFGPKKEHPQRGGLLPWPTYPDGRTPLPMLPNGQPDFDAQRTGVPSPGSQAFGAQAPQAGPPPQHVAGQYPGAPQAQPHQAQYPAPQQVPPQAGNPYYGDPQAGHPQAPPHAPGQPGQPPRYPAPPQ